MMPVDEKLLATVIRESLKAGDRFQATITSNSMAPFLRREDEIAVEVTAKVAPGDIAVYYRGRDLIAHRFWLAYPHEDGVYLIFRGDRLPHFDPPIPEADLVGRLTARYRQKQTLSLDTNQARRVNRLIFNLCQLEAHLTRVPLPAPVATDDTTQATQAPILLAHLRDRLVRAIVFRTTDFLLAFSQLIDQ